MKETDETIRRDIEDIIWVLWPKRTFTAAEIHAAIKGHLNRPWRLNEVEEQLDALVSSAEFVKSGAIPPTYSLRAPGLRPK